MIPTVRIPLVQGRTLRIDKGSSGDDALSNLREGTSLDRGTRVESHQRILNEVCYAPPENRIG